VELKPAYYRQAMKNMEEAARGRKVETTLFDAEAVA
jgi:hypothetical protein